MKAHKNLLRHLLLSRYEWVEQRMLARAARNGYGEVTAAMSRLFTHLGGRPVGLSELARRLGVSRQAVHQLAREAAALNLVEFVPSETDGRVKLLRFTQRGWAMSDSAAEEIAAIEAEIAQQIGAPALQTLRELLSQPWGPGER